MANEKYQVLTAPKAEGVSLDDAREALAAQYPAYDVEVFEQGEEIVAKLARKEAAPGKVPPFLDEEDDAPAENAPKEDAPEDDGDEEADEKPPSDDDEKPKGEKKDKDDKDDEGGVGDLGKALKALDTLKSVLPKLETQLKSLNGGELPEGLGDGPLGPEGGPAGPGGPPGLGGPPAGPDGPSQALLDSVGPTPGKPTPGNAAPRIPGLGNAGPHPPRPGVGVQTFTNVKQNKFVYRPAFNEDGSKVSMAEATQEIVNHPRYASYDVQEIKLDDTATQYVAHLKLRS